MDINIKEKIIKVSLLNMFEKGWFDICSVDDCLKIAGIIPDKEKYDMLHALHCINWNKMDRDIREWVIKTLEEIFGECPENLSPIKEMKISILQRVFGKVHVIELN